MSHSSCHIFVHAIFATKYERADIIINTDGKDVVQVVDLIKWHRSTGSKEPIKIVWTEVVVDTHDGNRVLLIP